MVRQKVFIIYHHVNDQWYTKELKSLRGDIFE